MMTVPSANYKSVPTRVRQSEAMRRRAVWRVVRLGVLAGAAYAVWRAVEANRRPDDPGWEPQPFPFPPQPRRPADPSDPGAGAVATTDAAASVEASAGTCPSSHPVKGKRASGIYHQPGGLSYDRTVPDRCYRDAAAAEADGLRAAKR
jgi:hypothetical protein